MRTKLMVFAAAFMARGFGLRWRAFMSAAYERA